MQIAGIIPSRMNSVRFPGKALALIDGKPMLLRVYEAAVKSAVLDPVFVATDSEAIIDFCREHRIPVLLTSSSHQTPTSRVHEAAGCITADYYVMIGGDEPLLSGQDIRDVVQKGIDAMKASDGPFVVNAMGQIPGTGLTAIPQEALDPSNIKIVCNPDGLGLYASRSPIPYPKGRTDVPYRKFVSIGLYTKQALDFFVSTPFGMLEQTEEFDLLRFMEHGKRVLFIEISGRTLSVDTPSDLKKTELLLGGIKQ